MTELDIAERCLMEKDAHLAKVSLDHFYAYCCGYNAARNALGQPHLTMGYDPRTTELAFYSMIPEPDSWPSSSACVSFLNVKHSSPREAFTEWISVCRRCPPRPDGGPTARTLPRPFLEFVSKRLPSERWLCDVALGSNADVSHVWSLFSGYCWGERDLGVFPTKVGDTLVSFQSWAENRFPFCKGNPWYRAFLVVSLGYPARSLEAFFSSFNVFLQGGKPDDLGAWAKQMQDTISDGTGAESQMPDELKQSIRKLSPE